MCGIIGLMTRREVGTDLVEGCSRFSTAPGLGGIITSDGTFHLKKGNGTVGSVFNRRTSRA